MGHFHGHSDHALQASYHHLGTLVARHSWPQDFIRGRLAFSLRLRVTGSRPCLSSPVWILGSGRPLKTIRLPGPLGLRPDVPVHWARRGIGFHTRDSRLTLVVVTSLPDDDLLGL